MAEAKTNGRRKLTPLDAGRIREEHRRGASQRQLAKKYNVSQMAIWQVVNGRTFREAS